MNAKIGHKIKKSNKTDLSRHSLGTTVKKKLFVEALKSSRGIIKTACEQVGICRQTYYEWCAADVNFKQQVDAVTEIQIDFVESKLVEAIDNVNVQAITFYLKTKGKKRGYEEEQNIKLSGELNVDVRQLTNEELQAIIEGQSISGIGVKASE